ncbi:tetratricopeptide repeat protein [Asticcacaulis sp. AC402]|uniref:tetratricopeptide repeat protein n=1 Tax=Asticcacaulis sp. AC402 TaxID=1282361 RepID=UPI0003C3CDC7|nr:tetratricopeptide repeat protein [Asticcacaulis sp. AC402]ESQ76202.1 hypothetical protein ABAC402_05450 [Asticcacaulis sp. AC402]
MIRAVVLAIFLSLLTSPSLALTHETGWLGRPIEDVRVAAEAGDAQAQLEMGLRYYHKRDIKDDAVALAWFKKAAAQGLPGAEYEVATMYALGEGTPVDYAQAMIWFRKSVDHGVVKAYLDIGVMYLMGEGVEPDPVEAVRWFRQGAELGDRECQFWLGMTLRDGKGAPQDYVEAMKWLRAAAAQGHAKAAYALGDMIKAGHGTEKDLVVGQAWRIMGKYLEAPAGPDGSTVVGAILVSPDLTKEQNQQAQDYYGRLMEELGFNQV